jgi:hypothetical protein
MNGINKSNIDALKCITSYVLYKMHFSFDQTEAIGSRGRLSTPSSLRIMLAEDVT